MRILTKEKQEEFTKRLEQGIELGEQRSKLKIARKLQAQRMSTELIEQLTDIALLHS